ncbi:MAG: hypothetical protein LUC44_05325 [Prevotellaceae bacterium]|nr:hypothetical protein [Prevotellaceae bacterium]
MRTVSRIALILAAWALLPTACSDALTTNKYSSLPAKFSYTPVSSISQLYTSCNSQGEWCTIKLSNGKFYFTNLTGTGEATQTALNGYTGFYMGLCGFIVGLPNIPELGNDYSVVTCYDLACSNCYAERSVTKQLTLMSGGYAHCSACDLTYNLNNLGVVSDEGKNNFGFTKFRSLYRYRVYYGNDTLSINN